MRKKISSQSYRPQYDISRHHAWAGTVLLSVLLALRIFLEMAENKYIPDTVFIILGVIIAFYTLGALFFTFRYRRALLQQEARQEALEIKQHTFEESDKTAEKQQYKIKKKKQKAQIKKEKKTAK